MKNSVAFIAIILILISCTKEAALRNDSVRLSIATTNAVTANKNTFKKSTPVTFHLVSVQTTANAGWWTMDVKEGWDGTGPMLQQWFQMQSTDPAPFNDSTYLYLKHASEENVPGQEERVSVQDGQFNIHLLKQSEHSKTVDGITTIIQKGKWELKKTYGIYSMYNQCVGGHYTYTFTSQEPQYYYDGNGVAHPYGETKREVYLKGVLKQ